MSSPADDAEALLRATCGERLQRDFPLAPMTTFRLGGPAALFLEPGSVEDLAAVSRVVAETGVEVVVIGKGSNVLVSDEGFRGLVLRLGKSFRWVERAGHVLTAGAANGVPQLAGIAQSNSLSGLEFGVAIPASLGGALVMNAGAHGHEISEVVQEAHVYSIPEGESMVVPTGELGFGYRHSRLPEGSLVLSASLSLTPSNPPDIRRLMEETREWRRATQPLAEPNCGSVFKNPPGDHAARLVEASGAAELSVGGASVSSKHSNFIVAGPGARAADVVELIALVKRAVAEKSGVALETEVRLIGRFDRVPS